MTSIFLFAFGAVFGSFINVIAMRYDPAAFLFSNKVIGGRSHCPKCNRQLRWFELVPFFSFVFLLGKCRTCKARLSLQYFLVELVSALIFVLVPFGGSFMFTAPLVKNILIGLWIAVFSLLLLMSLIDLRLTIIPDEINIILAVLAVPVVRFSAGLFQSSFLGAYAMLFSFQNIWLDHIVGALAGGLFFGFLIALTRGRGMGMGDMKLGAALGLLFGWPDIGLLISAAFIIGSLVSIVLMALKGKTLKSFLPFGPFLALGSAAVYFAGYRILDFYFKLFPLK